MLSSVAEDRIVNFLMSQIMGKNTEKHYCFCNVRRSLTFITFMDYLNDYLPTSLSSYIFPVEEPTYDIFLLNTVEEYLPKILEWRIHEAVPQVRC